MLLRSISQHVKDQNWFAVALDFVIVVVGVFIGIQVANWNDSRAFNARELELLHELRSEIKDGIQLSTSRGDAYEQAAAAGKRSLAFIANDATCGNECWPVLVDFMHASQWQDMRITRTTYDEMRRLGLPSARPIVEAVEAFHAQSDQIARAMEDKPGYRSLVRQMISVSAQEAYWETCHDLRDGYETYVLDCAKAVPDDVAASSVVMIINHPQIAPSLTEWTGDMLAVPGDLNAQNEAGTRAIAAIQSELAARQ
jgi:hypothetical protein